MHSSLVSIIIPAFNCEKFISEAIESCIHQTHENLEIIVIDDGSIDATYTIALRYANMDNRVRVYKNTKNLGKVVSVNRALSIIKGNYVSFLDADDTLKTDKVRKQYEFLLEHSDYLFCGTDYVYFKDDNILARMYLSKKTIHTTDFLKNISSTFLGASIMYRVNEKSSKLRFRNFFDRIPGEDLDFIGQLLDLGPGKNISYTGYCYRFNANSVTRKVNQSNLEIFAHEVVEFLTMQRLKNEGEDSLNSNLNGLDSLVSRINNRKIDYDRRFVIRSALNKNRNQLIKVISNRNHSFSVRLRLLSIFLIIATLLPYRLMFALRHLKR